MQANAPRLRHALTATGLTCAVLLALTLMLTLAGCGGDDSGQGTKAAPSDAQSAEEAANKEAADAAQALSNHFQQRLEENGSVTPLLEEGRKLAKKYPDYGPVHLLLGQMLVSDGKLKEGYSQMQRAIELDPDDADVHLIAGTAAAMLHKYEAAKDQYAKAVSLDPTNGKYRMHLAKAYMEMQRYDEARLELLRALRQDSSLDQAYGVMAELYARQNEVDLALQQVRRALSLLPPDSEMSREQRERKVNYIRQRSALLRRNSQVEDALSVLRDLPKDQWYEPKVMEDFATCWMMLGKPEKGAEHYEQALKQNPTDAVAAAGTARWYLKARQPADADRMIKQLGYIDPKYPDLPELREKLHELTSASAATNTAQ